MAVGHSAASVRPHGRRWIATSTTSCARASASPVTVSPCFGPCHALVPANCTRPTPRLSQLVNEMAPTLALPPRGRCGRDRHTAAAVVPQRHLRGRVRGRAGRQGHQGLGCAQGERGGGRRRGVKRGVKRGGRRVTGSLLARRGRSGSAQFITWPRLVTPWRGRGHSPPSGQSNAACLAALLSDEWSHVSSFPRHGFYICPLFSVLPPGARSL